MASQYPRLISQITKPKTYTERLAVIKSLQDAQLLDLLVYADQKYYNEDVNVVSDAIYDAIREEYQARTGVEWTPPSPTTGKKIRLPYHLGSMDKVKPGDRQLERWTRTYPGPYLVSAKLDGVSALYIKRRDGARLYTRGDGTYGQDITFLLRDLKLPDLGEFPALRGEIIMSKSDFRRHKFTKDDGTPYNNARNTVSGVVNSKPDGYREDIAGVMHFIAYEIIGTDDTQPPPSTQLTQLRASPFRTVPFTTSDEISEQSLSDKLVEWIADLDYEIDGLVVYSDQPYQRNTSGNPDYAKAFKIDLDELTATTKVTGVTWQISRTKFIKPVLELEPVRLDGVKVKRATAYNAKFVFDNKIGAGAVVKIIRSGGVIPKVLDVVQPADEPDEPTVPHHWNATRVDLILDQSSENTAALTAAQKTVNVKKIHHFFKTLGTESLGERTVEKIYEGAFEIEEGQQPFIIDFLRLTSDDISFLGPKLSVTVVDNMRDAVKRADLPRLMSASQLFGRGMAEKRLQAVMATIPDFWHKYGGGFEPVTPKIERELSQIEGFAGVTAQQIAKGYQPFYRFYEEIREFTNPSIRRHAPKPLTIADLLLGSGLSRDLPQHLAVRLDHSLDLVDLGELIRDGELTPEQATGILGEVEGVTSAVAGGLAGRLVDFVEFLTSIESQVPILRTERPTLDDEMLVEDDEGDEDGEEGDIDMGDEQEIQSSDEADETLPQVPQNIVLSEIRGKSRYDRLIRERGGSTANSVTSSTSLVVIGDAATQTGKRKAAEKKGIPVMTLDQFIKHYQLE